MNKIICGELNYEEKRYYFNFNNNILVIQPENMLPTINCFFEHFVNTGEVLNSRINLFGETSEGKNICFINIKLSKIGRGCFQAFVPAYIIGKTNTLSPLPTCDNIDKMIFEGKCLDKLYYPKKIIKENNFLKSENLKLEVDYKNFNKEEFIIDKDVYSYYSSWEMPYTKDINNVLNVKTKLCIDFDKPKNISDIIEYYINVNKFFCFLNNRNLVNFNSLKLYKKVYLYDDIDKTTKETSTDFDLFITPPDKVIDIDENINSIRLENIKKNYKKIFKGIKEKDFLIGYYPDNKKDNSYVDNDKYTQVSSAFESEFRRLFPDFKSSINEDYKKIKDSILRHLSYKKRQKKSKKQNNYCEYFENIIKSIDGTLEEKIIFVFDRYEDILNLARKQFLNKYKIEKVKDTVLAKSFSERRNKISHGKLTEPFDDLEVISYMLLRMSVYCISFERFGYTKEEINIMVNKLF